MEVQKWKKKKDKAEADGDLALLFSACKELAEIYFRDEKYDLALEEYKEMEKVSIINENKMDIARCNRMIGEVYSEKGEFDKAIKHQIKHLNLSKEEKDKVEEQRALATLGRTYFLLAETKEVLGDKANADLSLNEAKSYFLESLQVCEQLSDDTVSLKQRMEMRSRLFLNLGLVFDSQKKVEEAEQYLSKAVRICQKLDLYEDLFRSYTALGTVYHKNEKGKEALSTFDRAIPVAERLSNKSQSLCEVLLLKSDVLIDQPNYRGARQTLLRAYKTKCPTQSTRNEIEKKLRIVAAMCETEQKLCEITPDSDQQIEKKLYEDLGDMAAELGKFRLALKYYHLMLTCVEKIGSDRKSLIECYVSLSQTYKDDKQYNKALEFFKKELLLEEKDDPSEACRTCMNMADIYQLQDKEDMMIEMYKKAEKYAENADNPKLIRMVLQSLHIALTERDNIILADQIEQELKNLDDPMFESSDDEENEIKEFGAHIVLDDLTDAELSDGEQKVKLTRTRTKAKPSIHKRNEKGETPLHLAAISGNATLASKLIDQGHSVDVKDHSGWTPLHEACNHGNLEVAEVLLKKGASVNDRGGPHCDGFTPLLDAASNGNLEIIQLLLEHGASPLMRTNSGESVLDCLSGWRKRRLEEFGCDLDNTTLTMFNFLFEKLQQTLEKAGQKTSKESKLSLKAIKKFNSQPRFLTSTCPELVEPNRFSQENPATEYERAMKALRHKNKPDLVSPMVTKKPNVPALLTSDETMDENWLDDDLMIARPSKKRRTEFIGEPLRKSETSRIKQPQKMNPITELSDESEEIKDLNSDSPSSSPVHSPVFFDSPSTSGGLSNKLKEMNVNRKKQISLLDSGVSKEKLVRTNSSQDVSTSYAPKPMTYVKVKVEDKLLLVPITSDDEKNVAWLANETAQRYRSLEGVEPVLRLMTQDGAILVDSDPISLILNMGDLVGNVLSWNYPSISAIYEESCKSNHISAKRYVLTMLEACQATNKISLDDLYLEWSQLGPIFKALSHHQPLQCLEISGNYVNDAHIKEVAEYVVKLPQLRVLNLSNINITSAGLGAFSQVIQEHKGLQRLQVLNLGFNPLNDCLKPLAELLNTIPSLVSLSLESVGLLPQSFRSFQNFTLESLEVLNINENDIGNEGIIDVLGRLDSRTIVELRLANTSSTTVREVAMFLQQNTAPSLSILDLSYCKATDLELMELVKGANSCPRLKTLILDGVPDSSNNNISPLLNSQIRELSICGLQANQVFQVEDNFSTLSISSCIDQPWARQGPYGFFTNRNTTTH